MKTKIIIAFSILLSAQFANSQSITGKVLSRVLASDNFESQTDWDRCGILNNQLGGTENYSWYYWGGQLAWPGVSAIGGNKGMGIVWGGVVPLTGFVFDADSTYQIDCLIHPTGGNDGSWNNNIGIHIYATNNTDIWQNSGVRVRIQNGETGTGFGNPSTLLAEWWSGANKDYANSTVKDFSTTPTVYSIDGTAGANYWIPLKLVLKGDGTLAKPLIIDYYLKDSFVGTTSFDNLSTLGDKTIGFVRYGNSNDHAAFDNFVLSTLKTSLTTAVTKPKASDTQLKYNNVNRILEVNMLNAATYQIYNMSGKLVLNGVISSNNSLVKVEKLDKGIFVLKVSDNSNATNKTLCFMVQ